MAQTVAGRVIGLAAAAILAMSQAVAAQSAWTASTHDSGTYLFADASDPGGTLGVGCTAPSPQGRPAIETGSHESHVTPPYGVVISFADALFDWPDSYRLDNVVLYLDGTGYRLPPVIMDELSGTAVQLAMTDAMVRGLYGVQRLILDTGTGKAYDYTTAGIDAALDTVLLYCASRWAALGHPLPALLNGMWAGAATTAPPTSGTMAEIARADAVQGCSGYAPRFAQNAVLLGDIDGDGQSDAVLDWSAVTCTQGAARPFCGASMCSADVYLSSTHARSGQTEQLLALGVQLLPLTNGLMGVALGGSLSNCHFAGRGDGGCTFLWYWNGADLVQLK